MKFRAILGLIAISAVFAVVSTAHAKSAKRAPWCEIASPAEGATVSGRSVTVVPIFFDINGVKRMEFYCDGVLKSGYNMGPRMKTYNFSWSPGSKGPHSLCVRAYNTYGEWADSSPDRNVTVQ